MTNNPMQFQLFLGRNIPNAGAITKGMMSDFIRQESVLMTQVALPVCQFV